MTLRSRRWSPVFRVLALTAGLVAPSSFAHFQLKAPASWWSQDGLGSPQKAPPCGSEGGGSATNAVTTVQAGSTVTINIVETIFHPGHYRVVLGLNGQGDLPADPPVTSGTTDCESTVIQQNPTFPLLADGKLVHTSAFSGAQSFQVTIPPNVTCTNCVLQVAQFMSNHGFNNPGGCFYHHCAVLNVVSGDGGVTPTTDAGQGDAGSPPSSDGGHSDAGTLGDAGTGTNDPAPVGCGCQASGVGLLAWAAAAWVARGSKRRSFF